MPDAPLGTITFLFTDIVGSSRLWEQFPDTMGKAIARHDDIVRGEVEKRNGYVFKTVGDAFCVAFHTVQDGLQAAIASQIALGREAWGEIGEISVRMGLHTGSAEHRGGDYFGSTLNRAARIEAAAHGGQILLSQVSHELLQDNPLPGITFKFLGEHRLRNLERPENIFQPLAEGLVGDHPPPRSLEVLPNNLPLQTTSFIGREKEMEDIRKALDKTRLLSLTGTGGTGKTRMAMEIGAQVIADYRDGVWLAEFATISEGERITEVVATAVGVREEPGRSLRATLINFFRGKNLLLILDNCEHLLSDAAALAADLLKASPQLKILATTRHSLGIAGEITFAIPPLKMFDVRLHELTGSDLVQQLSAYEAVKLFIARATAVQPDFAVTNANAPAVAQICSRLDGIPLAIELAAARVRVLGVEQIAARLNDRFRLLRGGSRFGLPHQQTLQALIDWSYDLLSEPERAIFRRLGVFVGGRTLEALEKVCSGNGVEDYEVLDLLQQLVDKSLVMVERDSAGQLRYTIIESVWQYAREKLEATDEMTAVRDRHLYYFLNLAEKAAPEFEGPNQAIWLDRFYVEQFNFRSAFEWALRSERIVKGMQLVVALQRGIEVRGNLTAALQFVRQALDHPAGKEPTEIRAKTYEAAGRFAWALDEYAEARQAYMEAIAIYETLGDKVAIAFNRALASFIDRGDRKLAEAEAGFLQAIEVAKESGDERLLAIGMSGLGSIFLDRGDMVTAQKHKEVSLEIYRRLGDHWVTGLILWGAARVAIAQGDGTAANDMISEWAQITRKLGNQWLAGYVVDTAAEVALLNGQLEQSARFFGAGEALREHFAMLLSPTEQKEHDAAVARLKELLPAEALTVAWSSGRELSAKDALNEAAGERE